jgi:hypothetical protein
LTVSSGRIAIPGARHCRIAKYYSRHVHMIVNRGLAAAGNETARACEWMLKGATFQAAGRKPYFKPSNLQGTK